MDILLDAIYTGILVSKKLGLFDEKSTPDPPSAIEDTYFDDYNILFIHKQVLNFFEYRKVVLYNEYKKEQSKLQERIKMPGLKVIEYESLSVEIKRYDKLLKDIHDDIDRKEYEALASKFIAEYQKVKNRVHVVVFGKTERTEPNYQRINIIQKFVNLASKYIKINLQCECMIDYDICANCEKPLGSDALGYCTHCYTEYTSYASNNGSKESRRTVFASNRLDEDDTLNNFIKTLNRFQGNQPDKPPESIYEQLDEYFDGLGVSKGEYFRTLELNELGLKNGTSHKMLLKALSYIKNGSHYYEDVNWIGHVYWGWKLPNISAYKDKIIDHYIKTQKIFYQIPSDERKRNSSLGTQYRLWRHLQLVGYSCSFQQFKIAENQKSIENQDRLWRMMCERVDDPEIYYIDS